MTVNIFTKIVGVSFVEKSSFYGLKEGDELLLEPEKNPKDPFAVAVKRADNKKKLGYLNAKSGLAYDTHQLLKEGAKVAARVSHLSGDWTTKEGISVPGDAFGVNITLSIEREAEK